MIWILTKVVGAVWSRHIISLVGTFHRTNENIVRKNNYIVINY